MTVLFSTTAMEAVVINLELRLGSLVRRLFSLRVPLRGLRFVGGRSNLGGWGGGAFSVMADEYQ